MFRYIKKVTLDNILFYFLLILIILAFGIIFKKYTNIYEGLTLNKKVYNKITSFIKKYDNDIKTILDETGVENLDSNLAVIKRLLDKKEVLEKISGKSGIGGAAGTLSGATSRFGGVFSNKRNKNTKDVNDEEDAGGDAGGDADDDEGGTSWLSGF